jgi:aminoglycoside N3'-acetyltransferase
MDEELFQKLKQSVEQMNAIKRGELAPGRIRIVEPRSLSSFQA